MTVLPPLILDDAAWELPAHETALYAPRVHAHALVIPVINEGERIRGQLARIAAAGLPVDVVIADGGSSDGSLDPGFMAQVGVRAVLTKTGPGKLSAQLRMAYAWCLQQGYAGIVTIDGNGKDGVEAVAAMVARLEAGCDYVQGSRYLPGGAAENTPLERTIANRLVHAPMLSIAGRHWFTDTTNGFRAYSARYLTHPGVQPFRPVFSVYNLLFYLTVRAGQLGLRVAHVPVERRYPDDGKVPTKIGGFASKLALLAETFMAATGGYTPDSAVGRAGWLWPVAVLVALLAVLLAGVAAAPPYSPDSWALWELSQTVVGDFYRFTHWRSYASEGPWSASFGTPFATDNAGIAAALDPRAYVTDWWPAAQPTLADDPAAWAGKVAGNLGRLAYVAAGLALSPLGFVAAAFLALPAALARLCRTGLRGHGAPHAVLTVFAVLMAAMLAPQLLTGYVEQRYFSALVWTALLAAASFGIAASGALAQRRVFARGAGAVAVVAAAALALTAPRAGEAAAFDDPADVRTLKACLAGVSDARVLVIGDDLFAARAGAQGGIAAMMAPRNLAEGRLDAADARSFAATFKVTHVLAAGPAHADRARKTFAVTPVPGCPLALYRLAG
ncbi:glycosyltransferase family 2 protein [Porphyrobacter sp. AAP82]|uniref:glycosyltransferase family 2 protein n=1 Tax=Porphyrobacter sp. AAP82 TaxID=1248917 RepID=UPI0002F7DEDD|nr:glycosyltransferase family 2 protein [Porphyrobacter sp. AAP82]